MGPTPPPLGAPGAARGGTLLAGRYRLDRPLASGGMAQVWTGRDEALGRPVAVKVLHPHLTGDATFVTRFRAEALAAARLAHPSVVAVYDTCSELGLEAIVMELVEGPTLRQRLDAERRLDPREAARIGARIADALGAAHAASIVHRDIKPANVLLSVDGRVLVTDFGIAKAAESGDLTREHQMLGTVKYLAPEQVRAQPVDGRTDIYSLGVVLFEMVCGQVPFLADTDAGTALARLERDPPSPRALVPDLDPSFAQTILRAMARAPEHRWPDAASLGVALRALAAGRPAFVPVSSPAPAPATRPVSPPAPEWRPADPSSGTAPTPLGAPAPTGPRHSRTGPALVAVVAAIVVPVLLLALGWRLLGPGSTDTVRPEVAAFDPFGTDGENDDQVGLTVDGDDETAWSTERYDDPDITLLKPGVGLTLDLGESRTVQAVEVGSTSSGWTAEVYVLDDPPSGDRNTWGPAAGTVEAADGDARIDLDATDGRYVLLWFTRAGDDGVVEVHEVRAVVST